MIGDSLRARWLGRVPYWEGDQLQRALQKRATDDYLIRHAVHLANVLTSNHN